MLKREEITEELLEKYFLVKEDKPKSLKEIFEDKYKNYLVTSKKERKLKFKLTSIVPNKYVKGKTELIFNEVGENLKKNEEIVETMNEETKEDIKN